MSAQVWIWALLAWAPAAPGEGESGGSEGGGSDTGEGADAAASADPSTGADAAASADASGWEAIPWQTVLLVLVVVVLLAALIYFLVKWWNKRTQDKEIEDSGPSTSSRLRKIWRPFYNALPVHAEHFPTFLVFGETGSGKTTLINNRVDWKGQAHQLENLPESDPDAPLQLYLGPDLIVQELSAALLRDESQAGKRALRQLWGELGTAATVVLTLDATALLAMDTASRRELAQLVRGKIGLFPEQVRDKVDIRVYLSKLDLIPGYLNFASTLGTDHPPVALREDAKLRDATTLLRQFDNHLAYALLQVSGAEFDALLSFYEELPELVAALEPMLRSLEGEEQLFGSRYLAHELHLGSQVPHSYIGDPFHVEHELIEDSISKHERRHRRGSVAIFALVSLLDVGLTSWHGHRVQQAREKVTIFEDVQDSSAQANMAERDAAEALGAAIEQVENSEKLWMRWAFQPYKEDVYKRFEATIYEHYLKPHFDTTSRIHLIYLVSIIFALDGTQLGELIIDEKQMWADELDFDPWVISAYVESSEIQRETIPSLPSPIDNPGEAWVHYLMELSEELEKSVLTPEQFDALKDTPKLYTPREYEVINEVRELLLAKEKQLPTDVTKMLREPLDPWGREHHGQLEALQHALRSIDIRALHTKTWGLATLAAELEAVHGPGESVSFEVPFGDHIEQGSISSADLDAVYARSRRHELITAVLDRIQDAPLRDGSVFFNTGVSRPDEGRISGYGGGPTKYIRGLYTKASFEGEVSTTLNFANAQFSGDATLPDGAAGDTAPSDAAASDAAANDTAPLDMDGADRYRLENAIRTAATNYAQSYKKELLDYYNSFTFDPGSEVALPYAIKPFSQANSWFSDFLLALTRNLALTYPDTDPGEFFTDQSRALDTFAALATLLAEDSGQIPGLAPYQELIASLQKDVASAVDEVGDPEAVELIGRLSTLGAFALGIQDGTNLDYEELASDWLYGSNVDPEWFGPFLAPIQQVERYGLLDVQAKVSTAWKTDVRPIALPVLALYPFEATSANEATPTDLEEVFRKQGEIPGAFWDAFERLIRPALREDKIAMLTGIRAPSGMLAMTRDLERLSDTLWDDKGERVELRVEIEFGLLPMEPYNDRYPSIASLSAGGGSVHGFNQRAEPQTLSYKWWEQGMSTVTVTLKLPGAEPDEADKQSVRYRLSAEGVFSLFHLLDVAEGVSPSTRNNTLTEIAMYRGTRCDRRGPQRTRRSQLTWPVPLGRYGAQTLDVPVLVVSDPWEAFEVRSCQ